MQPKTFYLYIHTAQLDVAAREGETALARNVRVLAGLGLTVPEGVTPLFVNADTEALDVHNLGHDVVQRAVLLDGLRWATLPATLRIDLMKIAHRTLAVTSCRAFNVELPDGKLDYALKTAW